MCTGGLNPEEPMWRNYVGVKYAKARLKGLCKNCFVLFYSYEHILKGVKWSEYKSY